MGNPTYIFVLEPALLSRPLHNIISPAFSPYLAVEALLGDSHGRCFYAYVRSLLNVRISGVCAVVGHRYKKRSKRAFFIFKSSG